MKAARWMVVALVFAVILPGSALAKDLAQRISVGYNQQATAGWVGGADSSLTGQFLSSSAISSKYWFDNKLAVEGLFGYYTAKNEDVGGWASQIVGKVNYVLNDETNLKFYTGGGLGIIPMKVDYGREEESYTGFLALALLGWEFFFEGLDNLGFDVEVGLQYIDIDTFAQFGTYGGGFGSLGIRYYF
jgi:hypothetical protein